MYFNNNFFKSYIFPSQTEIAELDLEAHVQKNVVGLEIAMHDLLWMQVIERIDYLLDNKSFLGTIEFFSLLVKIREEISTFDEIRYNAKILWLWNDSHEKDDVRMSQWCEHIDFVVDFVNQIRCNVGVKYLLDSNTASKIFSCMHDTKSS